MAEFENKDKEQVEVDSDDESVPSLEDGKQAEGEVSFHLSYLNLFYIFILYIIIFYFKLNYT